MARPQPLRAASKARRAEARRMLTENESAQLFNVEEIRGGTQGKSLTEMVKEKRDLGSAIDNAERIARAAEEERKKNFRDALKEGETNPANEVIREYFDNAKAFTLPPSPKELMERFTAGEDVRSELSKRYVEFGDQVKAMHDALEGAEGASEHLNTKLNKRMTDMLDVNSAFEDAIKLIENAQAAKDAKPSIDLPEAGQEAAA